MERSDKTEVQFDKENEWLDTSRDMKEMPYSMALFIQELESLHVRVALKSDELPEVKTREEQPPPETLSS